jgi:hypothetical protein
MMFLNWEWPAMACSSTARVTHDEKRKRRGHE